MNLQERLSLHRQKQAELYQREAPPICKRYGLNLKTDAEKVQELLTVTRELNQCALCRGGECPKRLRKYQRPVINEETLSVGYTNCPVAKRTWLIQKAKRILPARYVDKTFDDYEDTPEDGVKVGQYPVQGVRK